MQILESFPQVVRKFAVVCEIQNSSDLARKLRLIISEMFDIKSLGLEEFFDGCVRQDIVEGCCGVFTTDKAGTRRIETDCLIFNKLGFCPVSKDQLLFKLTVMRKIGVTPDITKLRVRKVKNGQ